MKSKRQINKEWQKNDPGGDRAAVVRFAMEYNESK